MSEDIHKWTRGRYTLMFDEHTFFVFDNEKEDRMTALETTERLNEQQDTINRQTEQHKARLNKLIDENGELRMRIVEQQATINKIKQGIRIAYEKKPYPTIEDIEKEIE